MRRNDREVTDLGEIVEIMKNCDVCRLALNDDGFPVGSIATVLYIDDLDNVFIEWVSNGRLTSFSKKNFKSLFDMAG